MLSVDWLTVVMSRVIVSITESIEFLLCPDRRAVICLDWEDSSTWLSTQLAAADACASWSHTSRWPTLPTEGAAHFVFCSKVAGLSTFAYRSQSVWRCKNNVFYCSMMSHLLTNCWYEIVLFKDGWYLVCICLVWLHSALRLILRNLILDDD